MIEIHQDLQSLLNDLVRLAPLHVYHKAHATGVVFVKRIVETLFRREAGEGAVPGALRMVGHFFREGDVITVNRLFEYKFCYFLIKIERSATFLHHPMETLRARIAIKASQSRGKAKNSFSRASQGPKPAFGV